MRPSSAWPKASGTSARVPKKILFHSAVHHFLAAAADCRARDVSSAAEWTRFVDSLSFADLGNGKVEVRHEYPTPGTLQFTVRDATLYQRGDNERHRVAQAPLVFRDADATLERNAAFFRDRVLQAADQARLARTQHPGDDPLDAAESARLRSEADFHDEWATNARPETVDVRRMNEACTAPEMRFITHTLGDLRGKRLLDVGCGLGEASVYFAMCGADVTATDLSPGMLAHTQALAAANQVTLTTVLSSSESFDVADGARFDIVYIGNALHHVDIPRTMAQLVAHLADDGVFVSWDPVAYNPLINIYRRIATAVRTADEHPLTLADIRQIRSHFATSTTRYFWLFTLTVFVLMVLQRRNPNRERFWKTVVDEGDRWAWIYLPLERLDHWVLRWLPFLRPLCWNVVVVGRNPRRS